MRRTDLGQLRLDVFGLGDFLLSRQFATQAAKTVVDQVGIDDVGFAVIAYIGNLATLPGFPDLAAVYADGGRMFAMGNGGSSCDAAHFCVEFQHPVTTGRPALPAMNLVMDMAMFSAVCNDVGVRHVFTRQLEALGVWRATHAVVADSATTD